MKRKRLNFLKKLALVALPLLFILPAYARLYTINGGSMAPTVLTGDRLLVNLAAYDLKVPYTDVILAQVGQPKRGDLVVYHDPRGYPGMKRIMGVPGDEIEMRENEVFINGESIRHSLRDDEELKHQLAQLDLSNLKVDLGDVFAEEKLGKDHYVISFTPGRSELESYSSVAIPDGCYFLLGDHRDFSGDSRFEWQSFMKREQIIGRVEAGVNDFAK